MKKGFTTGSCAAAAAKAAAYMLLGGNRTGTVEIITPRGLSYSPRIEEIKISEDSVSCAVRKEAGDDPDITDKILVFAKVSHAADETGDKKVIIDGGEGIGRVTRPGLDQPVGNAAINSVPRQMIEKEVREVMELFEHDGALKVVISVSGGRELALKTFNPKLGIEGGISIIGTTGIVEPMSTKALLDTIYVQLRQLKAMGKENTVISPGNYGLEFMKKEYGYDLDEAVKCSNYIGDTIDMAAELGFKKLLLCGHAGKLIKLSGGIMNTHSKEADCRMELMVSSALRCGASNEVLNEILNCATTEEAINIYIREGILTECFEDIMKKAEFYLDKKAAGRIKTEFLIFSNKYGLLGKTEGALKLLENSRQ